MNGTAKNYLSNLQGIQCQVVAQSGASREDGNESSGPKTCPEFIEQSNDFIVFL